jgi:putative hydrolase of the HAD superfamily
LPSNAILLFDLGGVLVESTGRSALRRLLPHLADDSIMDRWLRSPSVIRFESGRTEPQAFAREFLAEWELGIGEAAFLGDFASWVTGFYEGAPALIESLRLRYRVGCLSNTNVLHWERLAQARSLFDPCFASHMTGHLKPGREAYEHALEALGVPASDVYFFDDLAPNVEAARAAGINAFQVSGVPALAARLREEGLG